MKLMELKNWPIFGVLDPDFIASVKLTFVFENDGLSKAIIVTKDDDVFSLGHNGHGQLGCGNLVTQSIPARVSDVNGNKNIVSIACGSISSFAISDDGEVFAWGYNPDGRLGIRNMANQHLPTKIMLSGVFFFFKVSCGNEHTLALSDEGSLYSWGVNNSNGQLGAGRTSNLHSPTRVAADLGHIVDIAAHGHTSSAETYNKVYMWGQSRGQPISKPKETLFESLHDVFACCLTPAVTYKPVEAKQSDDFSILHSLELAFDDAVNHILKRVTSNLSLRTTIHAHKTILRIRSDHFRRMFTGEWEENQSGVVNVDKDVRYVVFRAFFKYLYTDKIDLSPDDAIDLFKLANYYCESRLQDECETLIKLSITIDNAVRLYVSAISCNAKKLEKFSVQYMLHHLIAVAQSKSFQDLDGETFKTLMMRLIDNGCFKN